MADSKKAAALIKSEVGGLIKDVDAKQVAGNIKVLLGEGKQIQEFGAADWMFVFGLSEEEIVWDKVEGKLEVAFLHEGDKAKDIAATLVSSMKEVKALYAQLRAGEISEPDFLYESEWACLDAVVSILSLYLKASPIDVEVLGITINEATLNTRYQAIKDDLRGQWEEMLARHAEEQAALAGKLDSEYQTYVSWLSREMEEFNQLLLRAFSDDPAEALSGSAELAAFLNVAPEAVLNSVEAVDDFFLD